jgi:uncharacterized membrane protein
MEPRTRARIEMTVSILLLVIGILCFALFIFPGRPWLGFSAFIVTLILHLPQLPKALVIAREKNISTMRTFIMTIFFGASWWRNVDKGILEK